MSGSVLLVAVSARMLAQLAVADGFDVVAYDRFGDADLRRIASGCSIAHDLDGRGGLADLVAAAAGVRAPALVYGAGLENRPDLVRTLVAGRELLGTPPAALDAVRDPWRLAPVVHEAGGAFPLTLPAAPAGQSPIAWLHKPRRGGGGRGVRRWRGGRLRDGQLLQEQRDGRPCSAVAVAGDGRAALLGLTEQLVGEARLGARGFTWCGNVSPPRLPAGERERMATALGAIAGRLARRFGLSGIFGIDCIWDGRTVWVLEVNPRPPAGLEVVDLLRGGGSFALHVAACRAGRVDDGRHPSGQAAAKVVLYARRALVGPPVAWWPARARDIPRPATTIAAGHPICTLVATGPEPRALLQGLLGEAADLQDALARHGEAVAVHA